MALERKMLTEILENDHKLNDMDQRFLESIETQMNKAEAMNFEFKMSDKQKKWFNDLYHKCVIVR